MNPTRRFVLLSTAYALAAVALALAGVPHADLALLVAQYAVLLPVAWRALRRPAPDGPLERAISTPRDVDARLLAIVGALTALAVVLVARWWDRGMLWGDESAYRAQAEMFASGHLWAAAPAPTAADAARSAHELHFTHFILHDGHWFTKYPPLWPAVLALGVLAGARWLVNPLLAVIALGIIYRMARRELGAAPRFALLVAIASPFFWMMAASQMSHLLGLVCCAGAAYAVLWGVRTRRAAGLVGAMALVAACVFVRPFTAVCAAVALAPAFFARPVRHLLPRVLAAGVAIGAATVGALALYNVVYTGHATLSPYALYRGTALPVELSASPHVLLGNLREAARWAVEGTMIFTWPLLFALAGYALVVDTYASRRDAARPGEAGACDRSRANKLLAWTWCVFVIAELFCTEGSSARFGDRYLFEALFAPVLLAARGAALGFARWRDARTVATALTLAGLVQAAVLVCPTLAEIAPYVHVHAAVDALPPDGSVVFFPVTARFTGDRFDLNEVPWRTAPHLFLVDPGPARRAAVAHAEGRSRWVVVSYARGHVVVR